MNRPALAFGVLMPYIRSEEELTVAVEAWIRSHFLHKRVERYTNALFSLFFWNMIINVRRILNLSSNQPGPQAWEIQSEPKLSINLTIPHSCKCVYNALILMSGMMSSE
jgi:hypothetical protein